MMSGREVTLSLKGSNSSECTVNLNGATVTSWKNKGEEILFCSEKAVLDGTKAIRGGIPIVFPNFGPWDLGPQHGFARIKMWTAAEAVTESGDGSISRVFILEDDEETRNMWCARFRLEYTVGMGDDSLTTSLKVCNKGDESFSFTTLMHTYFRVDDIGKTGVKGLKGLKFEDKVHGGEHKEDREVVKIDENYDRIYKNCPGPVELFPDLEKSPSCRRLTTSNLNDTVVWNPWADKAKAMSDFGDEEYRSMLCVEAGAVSEPITLEAGKDMTFTQTLVVDKSSKL